MLLERFIAEEEGQKLNQFRQIVVAVALVIGGATGASAQRINCDPGPCGINTKIYREANAWVEESTGSIAAGKGLRLQSVMGAVQVRGADQPNVTYTIRKKVFRPLEEQAKRDFRCFDVSISRRPLEYVHVVGDWQHCTSGKMSVEYSLTVPSSSEWVKANTLGGSVEIRSIAGKAYAETAGGSITVDEIGSDTRVETMGGSITAANILGNAVLETAGGSITIGAVKGELRAETSGGSVELGSGAKNVSIETAGGSISVKQCGGELRASTAGGSIDIGSVNGGAILETAGGVIRLVSAGGMVRASNSGGAIKLHKLTKGVMAETASGGIIAEFVTRPGEFTPSHLETSVGDIIVYLPSDLPVTIKAGIELASGHKIRHDFGDAIRVVTEGDEWAKTVYADGNLNGGGPMLKVHTSNGNIEFRKTTSKR
jgi:DUF4097 and DUF4098 domain-containing protein YvlB